MSMDCWAIRHKPTGKYLPMRWNKRRGYSFDEPSDGFPRLLKTEHAAKLALRAWLMGKWETYATYTSDGPGLVQMTAPVAVSSRRAEDMEIVRFTLVETAAESAH